VHAPASGIYSFEIGSDDDSWVYVDNQMVCDLGGVHALSISTHTAFLSQGQHKLDIYFAERRSVQSGFHFRFLDENITTTIRFSDSPDILRVAANLTIALSGAASYDPDGMIVNHTWDFGDGKVGYGRSISHAYLEEGIYVITLAVRDDAGAETITSVSIEVVHEPEPSGEPEPTAPADAAETAPEEKAEAAVQLIESGDTEIMTAKKGPGAVPFGMALVALTVLAIAVGWIGKMVRPRWRKGEDVKIRY
jgi:fibro-slime domain-containing protein